MAIISVRVNEEDRAKLFTIAQRDNTSMTAVLAAAANKLSGVEDTVKRRKLSKTFHERAPKAPIIPVRVTDDAYAALKAKAKDAQTSVSGLLRTAALAV